MNIDTLKVISKGPGNGIFLVYALQGNTLYTGRGKKYETIKQKTSLHLKNQFATLSTYEFGTLFSSGKLAG